MGSEAKVILQNIMTCALSLGKRILYGYATERVDYIWITIYGNVTNVLFWSSSFCLICPSSIQYFSTYQFMN